MSGEKFPGVVVGQIISVRFAFSGTVSSVRKQVGDAVKKGETISSLDSSILQKELDLQLADYEKERSAFEIFNIKNTSVDDITKYEKTAAQAKLNSSVKAVELAKAKLDQVRLTSPVDGVILDMGELIVGQNITPSANSVRIVDTENYTFQFVINQQQLSIFRQPHRVAVRLPYITQEFNGVTMLPLSGSKSGFLINVRLEANSQLLPFLSGECELIE